VEKDELERFIQQKYAEARAGTVPDEAVPDEAAADDAAAKDGAAPDGAPTKAKNSSRRSARSGS
jgi:hypothetical protein